ncbi:hypothetical protein [Burkholderia sp. BCC1988]|uniref:hypothetical protein n=1 Tax=Burkholderia sp. BCC1988 TaxID=2817443 RepID=UPI002AAF9ABC|nr:hypothetical protein [Burkholderia sp. BCC1988]
MPYLGKADCHVCDREVDVSESRNGMAYYRCAACGAWMQLKGARGDRLLRQHIRAFHDPDAAPPTPAKPSETQPTPAPQPAPQTKAEPAPKPRPKAGFWSV